MANKLPEDVVFRTLLSLPVVSLLRFKCVCKSWYALITRHDFIREHIRHHRSPSNQNKNALFLLTWRHQNISDPVFCTFSYPTFQVSDVQPLPPPYVGIDGELRVSVVGSCDGLLCLCDASTQKFFLWNPATKESNLVPASIFRGRLCNYRHYSNAIGFGFDSKTNDYKIIRLRLVDSDSSVLHFEIDLYSLSTNSWREVENQPWFDVPDFRIYDGLSGTRTYTNGMVSWRAEYQDNFEEVLSFDMSKEVFLRTPMPDESVIGSAVYESKDLFVLNESVALAFRIRSEEQSEDWLHILLLGEYGVEDSWRKIYTLGPLTGLNRVLGSLKDDALLLENVDGQMFFYDSSNKVQKHLPIDGVPMTLRLMTFTETLLSVPGLLGGGGGERER
ncbi:hypothetical protein I3760_08G157800 [Carya illinoinensis]|nr:hypothetical protein I3760_08G157800 [Carya illinoinensis]